MGRMKDYLLSLQEKEYEEELKKERLEKEKTNRVQYKKKGVVINNGGV